MNKAEVVYAGAKIRNFLQFTTLLFLFCHSSLLFMPVQRYEIFCNSQLKYAKDYSDAGCLCRCKDTKFFAIHNYLFKILEPETVVYAGAKIRNFLQFTTDTEFQRYAVSCLCRCKDTKFFAIHNILRSSTP